MKRLALFSVLFVSCSRTPDAPPPSPPKPPVPLYDAALRDGTVVFWKGGLLVKPILKHIDSELTHAAIVLYNGPDPYVYEAVPPRVHKVPLAEYRRQMQEKVRESRRPMAWYIMQPMDRYTPSQLAAMKRHAESQLGRPYMLRGWWKGHEVRGIFCSQLVGDIIAKSGIIEAGGIHESPGSLYEKAHCISQVLCSVLGPQNPPGAPGRGGGSNASSLQGYDFSDWTAQVLVWGFSGRIAASIRLCRDGSEPGPLVIRILLLRRLHTAVEVLFEL
jgi:hypothetical protein